jgi:hypothetical protein
VSDPLVIGTLHPAYLLRGQWKHEPAQIHYLRLVRRLLEGEEFEAFDPDQPLPAKANLYPSVEEIEGWLSNPYNDDGVAIDIENAGPHLICVGIYRLYDESYICVRFRRQGGSPWWYGKDLERVVQAFAEFLADPEVPKCYHNGQAHDIPYLEYLGFKPAGYAFDTMIASHCAYSEMPKGLEYLSVLLVGAQPWKHLTKEEDLEEGK